MEDQCDEDGNCRCDPDGNCACKSNVEGMKCAACKLGSFGLSRANPEGCFDCFCFGRARTCEQASLAWTQVRFRFFQSTDVSVTYLNGFLAMDLWPDGIHDIPP